MSDFVQFLQMILFAMISGPFGRPRATDPMSAPPFGAAQKPGSETEAAPSTAAFRRQRGPERSGGRPEAVICRRNVGSRDPADRR